MVDGKGGLGGGLGRVLLGEEVLRLVVVADGEEALLRQVQVSREVAQVAEDFLDELLAQVASGDVAVLVDAQLETGKGIGGAVGGTALAIGSGTAAWAMGMTG